MELSSVYSVRSICQTLDINRATVYYRKRMDEYEVELRDRMLRMPLGLEFSAQELHAERDELHFGIAAQDPGGTGQDQPGVRSTGAVTASGPA